MCIAEGRPGRLRTGGRAAGDAALPPIEALACLRERKCKVAGMNWPRIQQAFEEIAASIHEATTLECPVVIGELERLKLLIQLRMLTGSPTAASLQTPLPASTGQYLSVEEVARRFHVSRKWLYRHKRQMPHSQPSRKLLLFPEQAITSWFATRRKT